MRSEEIESTRLYSQKEVAEMLGISTRTVSRRLKDGTLDGRKVGRSYRIPGYSVKRYLTGKSAKDTLLGVIRDYQIRDYVSVRDTSDVAVLMVDAELPIDELDDLGGDPEVGTAYSVCRDEAGHPVYLYSVVFPVEWIREYDKEDDD